MNHLERVKLLLSNPKKFFAGLKKEKGVGITAMKPLGDGFLYRSPENAIRWSLGSGSEVLVCGTNSPEHVRQVADAVCKGPADKLEREDILKNAIELGKYVCRQCGECSGELMELFRLEGYYDRQMVDFLEHNPADYALRLRLAKWFALEEQAKKRYREMKIDEGQLQKEALGVTCPYDIDVARKAKIVLAKLNDRSPSLL